MKLRSVVFAAVLLVGASSQCFAATLRLSGNYSYLENKTCQASVSWGVDSGTGDTTDFSVVSNGSIRSTLAKITFNSSTQQATATGIEAIGSLVLGNTSEDVASSSVSLSGPFSVTNSTLTLGGKVYSAVYGGINNGIAARVRLLASSSTCIETVTLDRN